LTEARRSWAITKKDALIYYLRPGSLMFGIMFPVFLFLSFAVGRGLSIPALIPGLIAVTIFFSASSIGPMVIPTERKTRTYERMLMAPISPFFILFGEILGGAIYGAAIAVVPLLIGVLFYGTGISNVIALLAGIALATVGFSAMGIMFSSMPTENPGDVMMVLNFFRLPLLFVSGVFIPVSGLGPYWWITLISPLTYANDLLVYSINGTSFYCIVIDVLAILAFIAAFWWAGVELQKRNLKKM
jgi:ABC-2 type transport system permease protein